MATMTIKFKVRRFWVIAAGAAWSMGIRGKIFESLVNRSVHLVSD